MSQRMAVTLASHPHSKQDKKRLEGKRVGEGEKDRKEEAVVCICTKTYPEPLVEFLFCLIG